MILTYACVSCGHETCDDSARYERKRWPRCKRCNSRKGWAVVKLLFDDLPDVSTLPIRPQPLPYTFRPEERTNDR